MKVPGLSYSGQSGIGGSTINNAGSGEFPFPAPNSAGNKDMIFWAVAAFAVYMLVVKK